MRANAHRATMSRAAPPPSQTEIVSVPPAQPHTKLHLAFLASISLLFNVSATACVMGPPPRRGRASNWTIPITPLVQPRRQAPAKPQRPLGSLQPGNDTVAWLGVRFSTGPTQLPEADDGETGVRVEEIITGSAAETAGLRIGDIITDLSGIRVRDPEDLLLAVRVRDVGEEVNVTVMRRGEVQQLKVRLGRRSRPL